MPVVVTPNPFFVLVVIGRVSVIIVFDLCLFDRHNAADPIKKNAEGDGSMKESKKDYICCNPNCNYNGKVTIRGGCNIVLVVFLFLFGSIPAIIYAKSNAKSIASTGHSEVLLLGTVMPFYCAAGIILLLGIIPGLIYLIYGSRSKANCPKCNMRLPIDE
jgi:hypothetical protein